MPYFPPPDTIGEDLDPGTDTLATGRYLLQYTDLILTSAGRLTMEGTGRVLLGSFDAAPPNYVGTPKSIELGFTVRNNYMFEQQYRVGLAGVGRATLEGNSDLIIDDNFGVRPRIVLAGRG